MDKRSYFLTGWILALFLGVSWGLGHQSQWANFGPVMGVVLSLVGTGVVFGLTFEDK